MGFAQISWAKPVLDCAPSWIQLIRQEHTFSLSTRLGGPRGILLLEVVLNLSGSRWLRSSCRDVSYLGGEHNQIMPGGVARSKRALDIIVGVGLGIETIDDHVKNQADAWGATLLLCGGCSSPLHTYVAVSEKLNVAMYTFTGFEVSPTRYCSLLVPILATALYIRHRVHAVEPQILRSERKLNLNYFSRLSIGVEWGTVGPVFCRKYVLLVPSIVLSGLRNRPPLVGFYPALMSLSHRWLHAIPTLTSMVAIHAPWSCNSIDIGSKLFNHQMFVLLSPYDRHAEPVAEIFQRYSRLN